MKRGLDVVIAAIGVVVLSPLLATIALLVKLTSRGPVLFRAQRAGRHGRPFTLYKFRSMVAVPSGDQPRLTRRSDPRVTPMGRVLRRWKLDELPQLVNVLLGDMSLVGPRPEDPRYVALYSDDEKRVLSVRPGITSPTSLAYRDEESLLDRPDWEAHYTSVVMHEKLRAELADLDRRTIASDLAVIVKTLLFMTRR